MAPRFASLAPVCFIRRLIFFNANGVASIIRLFSNYENLKNENLMHLEYTVRVSEELGAFYFIAQCYAYMDMPFCM